MTDQLPVSERRLIEIVRLLPCPKCGNLRTITATGLVCEPCNGRLQRLLPRELRRLRAALYGDTLPSPKPKETPRGRPVHA